jgi:sporulation protein YlmC with PRC-barrel domain
MSDVRDLPNPDVASVSLAVHGTPHTARLEARESMDIPTNADVLCDNDVCGRSTYVILNPVTKAVTHVVVKQKGFPYAERLVPLDKVLESTPHEIRLRCTEEELGHMERFVETEFLEAAGAASLGGPYMMWPFSYPEYGLIALEHQHVPVGELAVRRGASVEAADGHVGRVDEFLVDATSEHVTHLVMREGHLWGQKDITIPVSQIDRIEEDTVYLKLDKKSIEALPAIPIHRE